MKKELNYEEAIAEVDKIVKKLSSEEIDVDTLATDVKRATQLLEILEAKLHKTQDEMKTLLKSLKLELTTVVRNCQIFDRIVVGLKAF